MNEATGLSIENKEKLTGLTEGLGKLLLKACFCKLIITIEEILQPSEGKLYSTANIGKLHSRYDGYKKIILEGSCADLILSVEISVELQNEFFVAILNLFLVASRVRSRNMLSTIFMNAVFAQRESLIEIGSNLIYFLVIDSEKSTEQSAKVGTANGKQP